MTAGMKKYLLAASNPKGSAVRGVNDHLEAMRNGWVTLWGTPQNSMTDRYILTDAGREALNAAEKSQ